MDKKTDKKTASPRHRLVPCASLEDGDEAAREIVRRVCSEPFDEHAFAVMTAGSERQSDLSAVLLYDEDYAVANVLWGSVKTALLALVDLARAGTHIICPSPGIHVFWKWEECTDEPYGGELWEVARDRWWVAAHPIFEQAVLFRAPAPPPVGTSGGAYRVKARLTDFPGSSIDDGWQTCDVQIARDPENAQELTVTFLTPLVFWYSEAFLDDVHLEIKGWIATRFPPRANRLDEYFDCEFYDDPRISYFQLSFYDSYTAYLTHPTHLECICSDSQEACFSCLCSAVVDARPAFLTKTDAYFTEWRALRNALVGIEHRLARSARLIQRAWRRSVADPAHPICRRRLQREFKDMMT